MRPLITHHPLLLSVMVATFLIWRVMESIVDIKTYKRLRAGVQRQDKGSYLVLFCLIASGIFFGILIAYKVPAADITSASVFFFWLGILLMWIGIALRLYAIRVLGVFFTTRVAITPEQTVVESGPYRLIRHPSYTGLLITLLGFGLSFTNNWLSLLVIMGCAVIGLSYRIQVEEYALKAQLGQRYQEYMQHTKRLIPFVI